MRIYAHTRLFISMYELAYCLCIVGGLLFLSLTALKNYATTNYIRLVCFNHRSWRPSRYAVTSVYELDRRHVLIDINGSSFSNGTFKSRGDVFHYLPTLYLSQRLGNVFKINLISVHSISAESTKNPVCEQRSEYKPTQDVSFYGLHHR